MGKAVQRQAKSMGLMNLPKYTFYCQPAGIKRKFSTTTPRFIYTINDWVASFDQSCQRDDAGGGRTAWSFILAPQSGLYIEITSKIAGFSAMSAENYVSQVDIYTENTDNVKTIVKILNDQWPDGMLNHIDLRKIEKKFKVNGNDVVNAINQFLQ
ncbi:MAG: hypothetical protein ACXAAI_12735 [Promethearchaeota archaeon]|jgi:hypothetical protein